MLRAVSHSHHGHGEPFATLSLDSGDRHLRRRRMTTDQGIEIMVDLPEAILLADGDTLLLDDGREVRIVAAEEELYRVMPGNVPLRHLAWHLGNRHLAAQIEEDRIFIRRDHVIRSMLEGLGATVDEVKAPFQPVHGAYHSHDHGHHGRHHHHDDETHR
jgi:urease accessory protein